MKRKITAVSLAFVAAFAASAVLAGAASASPGPLALDTEGAVTVDLTGEQVGHHVFKTFFGSITCKKLVFDGTASHGSTSIAFTPTYSECESSGKPVTFTHNGCTYLFTGGNETATANHFEGLTTTLSCPAGVTGIETHVYNNAGHTEKLCSYVVHPYTHKLHTTARNLTAATPDHIELVSELTSVGVKRMSGTVFTCGTETQTSNYTGTTTLKGYKHKGAHLAGEQVGILFTDPDSGC